MTCNACGDKAQKDCQLCKTCLSLVIAMKYDTPKPATFQDAVTILKKRLGR